MARPHCSRDGGPKEVRMPRAGQVEEVVDPNDELELLTPQDVAKLFKVPVSWVYNATRKRAQHPMPHIKVGIYTRFQEEAVRQWFQKQKVGYADQKRGPRARGAQ